MRRSLPSAILVVVGALLLADLILVNPTLASVSTALTELLVLLAAAAALAGAVALVLRHWHEIVRRGGDRAGSVAVGIGIASMLVAGFYPGSSGSADPLVAWLVAALLAPLIAALFALAFVFLLGAARGAVEIRARETTLMLAAAGTVVVLLLPLGGALGTWLATLAGWALAVPIGGVFRGLLIGVAIAIAIQAAKIVLNVDRADA